MFVNKVNGFFPRDSATFSRVGGIFTPGGVMDFIETLILSAPAGCYAGAAAVVTGANSKLRFVINGVLTGPLFDSPSNFPLTILEGDEVRVKDEMGNFSNILIATWEPDAQDYFTRAESLDPNAFDLDSFVGGLYPTAVKGYWNNFIISLKADGTWDEIDEICPLSGVTFGAMTAKVKHSGTATTTVVNFVSGDYTPAGPLPGLKGNGTSKEINTNWQPSDTITAPSGHHSMFTTEEATVASDNSREGSVDGANLFGGFFPFNTGAVISDMFSAPGGRISVSASIEGFLVLNGTASANRMLLNNAVIASGATPPGTAPASDYYLFGSGGAGWTDARRSIRTMGQGLTAGQETTLSNAVATLMASFGYV